LGVFLDLAIYASLMTLALGLFTSITFLALSHICIFIPALYFLPKTNFKKWNKSSWFLLAMSIAFILSVFVNQDIASNSFFPITKTKYYILAVVSIAPISYFFNKLDPSVAIKKIHYLILALFITTTLASLLGMFAVLTKFNLLKWQVASSMRNSGITGNVMNYAHNLALIQIIFTGMIIYRKEINKYINLNFLYLVWLINLLALIMSYTRGAILAFLIGLPFYFLKKNKKKFVALASSLILITTLGVGFNLFSNLILRHDSDAQRVSQWKAAYAGFKERPIFGLGYLNFDSMSVPLKIKYGIGSTDFGGHAHNNYLEALASTGIVGFIFFILWQIFWFNEMFKREDLFAKIAIPFIIAFVIGGLTQATFTLGANLFLTMSFYTLTQLNFMVIKEKVG
jgi:O-antigen ligase